MSIYTNYTSENTLDFLQQVIKRMPFIIQIIQTDRGQEFFAYKVQDMLIEMKIKFRPIKPFSPHLNGKIERSQRTDLDEFYSSIDIKNSDLAQQLLEWEEYYNKHREHSSLGQKTPYEKYQELQNTIPTKEEVHADYLLSNNDFIPQNYKVNNMIKKIKQNKKL